MDATPQFGTAEYSSQADTCKACHQPIAGVYYRANDAMLCNGCAQNLQHQIPQDRHAAFVRGIVFGLGGFVVGLVLYAAFTILTGIQIGYVSLAVGWLVGKAIMMGSKGVGGRRYQIAAVLLTYAAVSMAFIPIAIHYMRANPDKVSSTKTATSQTKTSRDRSSGAGQPSANDASTGSEDSQPAPAKPAMSRAEAIGRLVLLGLASPFLELSSGFSGVIGLVILFVGMRFAWKITGPSLVAVDGPYQTSSAAKA